MSERRAPPDDDGSRLLAVTDALDVLLRWMREELASDEANETFELMHLHTAITDAQGRQRVMNVARREAERCKGDQDLRSE
jgi:hypothetical protein